METPSADRSSSSEPCACRASISRGQYPAARTVKSRAEGPIGPASYPSGTGGPGQLLRELLSQKRSLARRGSPGGNLSCAPARVGLPAVRRVGNMTAPQPGWYQAADGNWYPPQPPPKKSTNPWMIIGWLVLGSLVLCGGGCGLVVLLGASSSTSKVASNTAAPNVSTASTPPTTAGPGTSQASPAPVGTSVSPAKDWTIVVVSANRNANATVKGYNQFNVPAAGKVFVTVNIAVKNGSDKPETAGANMQVSALTAGGVSVDRAFGCLAGAPDELDLSGAQLQPGASAQGTICFEVSAADADGLVLLAEPTFTLDKAKDQRFLALS